MDKKGPNRVENHEPIGPPALQKPKSPGGLSHVNRDNSLGFPAGSVKAGQRKGDVTYLEL